MKKPALLVLLLAAFFSLARPSFAQYSLVMTNGYGDVYRMNLMRDRDSYQAYRGVCSYRGFSLSGCSTTGEVVMLRIKATDSMPEHFSILSTSLRWDTTMYVLNDVFRWMNSTAMSGYENWYPFDMSCSVAMYINSGGFGSVSAAAAPSPFPSAVSLPPPDERIPDLSDARTIESLLREEPEAGTDSKTAFSLVMTNGYGDVYRMNMLRNRDSYQAYRGVCSYRGFSLSGCSTTGEVVMLRIKATATVPEHFSLVSTSLRWGTTMYFLNDVFRWINSTTLAGYENWYPFDMSCSVSFYISSGGFGSMSAPRTILASRPARAPGDPIPIGALLPLTGDLASIGKSQRAAIEIAFAEVANAPGMPSFQLLVEDTATDPHVALEKLQRFHAQGVQVVIGPGTSAEAEGLLEFANDNGMLLLSSASTAPRLAIANDNLVRLTMDDTHQARRLARQIVGDGMTNLAVLSRSDLYGEDLRTAFLQEYGALGGHVFLDEYLPRAPQFMPEVMSNVNDLVSAQIALTGTHDLGLLMIVFDEGQVLLEEAAAYPNLLAPQWYATDGFAGDTAMTTNPTAVHAARQTRLSCSQPADFTNELFSAVGAAIEASTGEPPRSYSHHAYDGLWLAAMALRDTAATGSVAQLRQAIRDNAASFAGATGPILFNAADDRADGGYDFWKVTASNAWANVAKTVPDAPLSRPAADVSSFGFLAAWASAAGATNYFLDVALDDQFSSFLPGYSNAPMGAVRSHALAELAPGQTYYYRVRAQNEAGIGPASATMSLSTPRSYANTIAAVSNAIVAAMASDGTVGVSIALVDDQEIVWAQGFGFADREAGIPVTTNTVFHVGSVSKAFTAATALHYAQRGLLDVYAPFTNVVPGVAWKARYPAARPITARDLMAHQSGLPGDLIRAGFLTKPLGRGRLETTNDLAKSYPILEPGTFNNYCNVGFVLLEAVSEGAAAAEGDPRPFEQLANARLFEPLGMDATSYVLDKPAISNHLARPYFFGNRMPDEHVEIYGTGSLYSRPVDMAQFLKDLFSDAPLVLSPETRRLMISDQSTNALFDVYAGGNVGLGWDTVADPRLAYAGPAVWKNGSTLAYSAQLHFLPEKKLGVAIAASSSSIIPTTIDVYALHLALLERDGLHWPTNPVVWPTNLADISQAELDALAGIYAGDVYDLVESHPGSLTYRRNVPDDDLTIDDLRLRDDGWFRSDAHPALALAFTNAHGRNLVLHRENHGTYETSSIYAERFTPPALPAAWSNRLDKTWVPRNTPPDDYIRLLGLGSQLTFRFADGVLYVETGGVPVDWALNPVSDDLAWLPGIANRGDAAIQIVDVGGIEHVLYAGYLFGPAPEEIPLADSVSGAIDTERFADWHEIQPASPPAPVGDVDDIFYQLTLSGAPANFLLRLFEADGVTPVAERTGNGPIDLVSGAAPLVLSIQPGSDGLQTGTYQIDFSVPLILRELIRDGDQYAMAWQGPTGAAVTVEAAPFLAPHDTFVPLIENLAATNLLLRETFPAGPDPERFFRIIEQESPTNRLGQVLLISDIHLSPFIDAAILPDLVAQPISQWDALFAVATNGLFTRDASGWKTTSPLLLQSALLNAKAAVPNPDAVLYAGDFVEYEIDQTYTNLVPGGTVEEGHALILKTTQYVHGKLRDAFPDAPLFFTLGNNDTFLGDYDIEESGDAYYAATAATFHSGAITNLIAYDAFAATFTNSGSFAAPFGPGRVVSLQTAYLSANYPRGTNSGREQLERLELELQSAEAAGEPVWILLHIPPGINPYETLRQQQAGAPAAAASDWQEPFLITFCQLAAAHSETIAGIVGGHYHNRSWQLIADPATTNPVATLQIANGILYNHGNNPGFTMLTYDRQTLAFVAENTYSLDVATYEGTLDPDVPWSIRYSQNQGYGIPDLTIASLESAWTSMAGFDSAPARHYNAEYSGGRPPYAITSTNWPVYRNAIRYTTPTQFLNAIP